MYCGAINVKLGGICCSISIFKDDKNSKLHKLTSTRTLVSIIIIVINADNQRAC